MNGYEYWQIDGHDLEYIDADHQYVVDGVCVPSITQVLKIKFGNKYAGVSSATLQRASEKGTEVHEAIERYCREGVESDLKELRNFKFLQKQYGFTVLQNEVPVILSADEPICAGRLDMTMMIGDSFIIGDIKRTSTLDKEYLAYQLNLYRIAYRQSYGIWADALKGLHLRDDVRKFVDIPINEGMAWELVEKFMEDRDE